MITYDMSIAEYIAHGGISASSFNVKSKTNPSYKSGMRDNKTVLDSASWECTFESALRCALLEPITFLRRYLIEPEGLDRSTQEGEKYVAQQILAGKILLKRNEFLNILEARDNVYKHPVVGALLRDGAGVAKASILEECPKTGVKMKCRPDYMITSINAIFELNIVTHSEKYFFAKTIIENKFHVREAFYRYIYQCATNKKLYDFLFIVIEKKQPFTVKVFEIDPITRLAGKCMVENHLQTLAHQRSVSFEKKLHTQQIATGF